MLLCYDKIGIILYYERHASHTVRQLGCHSDALSRALREAATELAVIRGGGGS